MSPDERTIHARAVLQVRALGFRRREVESLAPVKDRINIENRPAPIRARAKRREG